MTYTLQQLIDEWKLRRGFEPARSDAAFNRFDALDIDTYIARRVDKWYHDMLDRGPLSALVVADITPLLVSISHSATRAVYRLPDECRRIVSVDVDISRPSAVIARPDSPLARRQECQFARGEGGAPVAVRHGNHLHIYSHTSLPDAPPDRVLAIMTPEAGVYELSAEGLDSITDIIT